MTGCIQLGTWVWASESTARYMSYLPPQDTWSRQLFSGHRGLSIRMGAIVVCPSKSSEVLGYPTQRLCFINGSKA